MSIRTIKKTFLTRMLKSLFLSNLENILQEMGIKKILLKKWIGLIKLKLMMKSQLQCFQANIGPRGGFGEMETRIEAFGGVF